MRCICRCRLSQEKASGVTAGRQPTLATAVRSEIDARVRAQAEE
jgi:hypothetical protein